MLKPNAFANALAIISVLFYLVVILLYMLAPALGELVFKAQFLGADIKAQAPNRPEVWVSLVVIGLSTWLLGYAWATLYNHLAKGE